MGIYNVLIVDDEELSIRGIEKGVDWDSLNVGKVFKTHNIETAMRIIQDYKIHILLTDIELGDGTGIDLLTWVRQNIPSVVCVFFTCHEEFSYAREAVRLGVKEYLLKPIPYKELERILKKEIEELQTAEEKAEKYAFWDSINEEMVAEDEKEQAIAKVKNFIASNLSQELRREDLANLVNFSTSYLTRIFKEQEGVSLTDYIQDQRMKIAKYLLKVTELPVTEIAQRVGYSYHSYFTKYFKKTMNMTPQQYREEEKKKNGGLHNL